MALSCGIIANSILAVCDELPSASLDETLYLINKNEIDLSGTTVDADGQITLLALNSGSFIYKFDGTNNSLTPSVTEVIEGLLPTFTHSLQFLPFVKSQIDRNIIEQLTRGTYVGIVDRTGNKTFEVFGYDVGLRLLEMEWTYNDQAQGGVPLCTMRNQDNQSQEPRLPRIWLETDYDTTKTKLESLVTAGQP